MRSAAFSRIAPPSELACSWLNRANSGLSNRIREQNSLWYSVGRHARASVVAQVVVNTALVPHGGSCVCTGIGTRHEFSGLVRRTKVTKAQMCELRLTPDDCLSKWGYTIEPM